LFNNVEKSLQKNNASFDFEDFYLYNTYHECEHLMSEDREQQPRLLVVDDDNDFRTLVKSTLIDEGYTVDDVSSGEAAVEAIRHQQYEIVLLDIKMPGMDGVQTLKLLRQEAPNTDYIMITGFQDIALAIECIKLGAKEYLNKPIDAIDLTQRIRSMLRARIAEQKLKLREKEFNSRLLHEIRNPMTTVKSGISFLLKEMAGPLTDQQSEVLKHISSNVEKLVALVNDMIDLSKFESGNVMLELLPTNLEELIPAVCERLAPQAKAKKLTLNVVVNSSIPTLQLDTEKIEQVITNLIDNAIKYTDEGGTITVNSTLVKKQSNGTTREYAEIAVTDSGIGISSDELPFVFDKYKEVLTGKISKKKTTGLGLAICRSIAEAHKGMLTVESTPGKGSTFRIYLPVDIPA
jgi:signal transduction histidine kinase